jgi:MFS family permease
MQKRPPNALARINKTLVRMGHRAIQALPPIAARSRAVGVRQLFGQQFLQLTALLTVAYFAHIMTYYFLLKWIPKIVVDMGFSASLAGSVLVWQSVGGAFGAIFFGLLSQKFELRRLLVGSMFMGSGMVAYFGSGQSDLVQLSAIACIAGFFLNAAIVGFFALFVQSFPTEIRAGGTGFVIGIGRGGASVGPIVAGVLFDTGQSLQSVAVIMATGSAIAAILLLIMRPSRQVESS